MSRFLRFLRMFAIAVVCAFGAHAGAFADCSGTSGETFAVKTTAIGNGQEFRFTIKAKGEFCVDWGDGTYDTYNQSSTSGLAYIHSHAYSGSPTSRVIKIKGNAERYHPADWAWNNCSYDDGYSGACSKQASHGAIMFGNPPSSQREYYNMDGSQCTGSSCVNTPQFVAQIGDGNGNYTSLGKVFKTHTFGGNNVDPGFAYTFAGATNLTSIPEDLFGSKVTSTKPYMFSHTFDGTGITSIPQDLFKYVKKPGVVTGEVAMFLYTFANTNISAIPSGLFVRSKHGISSSLFEGTFSGCTNLTQSGIPYNIFKDFKPDDTISVFKRTFENIGITTLSDAARISTWFPTSMDGEFHKMYEGTFANNHNLTSISYGLNMFHVDLAASDGWRADGLFKSTFAGCEHLNSIPSDLFGNYRGGGTDGFNQTFSGCSALQSVPGTLFSKITGSGHGLFYSTFKESGLTSIPPALFSGLTGTGKSNMFYDTFWGCHGLTSVPANLFRITSVGDSTFRGTFAFCDNIGNGINGKLNANNDPIMQPSSLTVNSSKGYFAFASMFEGCSKLTTIAANIIRPIAGAFQDAMFARTFARSGLTSVPSAMFATYHKAPQRWLFKETFAGCSNLRTVANNIFSNMSGALKKGTFDGTFREDQCDENGENCQNSCGLRMNMSDLGSNFFGMAGGNVSGGPRPYIFRNTFKGCSGLVGEIPDYFFFNLSGNAVYYGSGNDPYLDCPEWDRFEEAISAGGYGCGLHGSRTGKSLFEGTFQGTGITGTVKALNFYNLTGTLAPAMFKNTFKDCTGLTSLGDYLFNSFSGASIDDSVSAFEGTFDGCSGLTNDISSLRMFTNLSGSAAPNLFKNTFRGCSSLTGGLSDRFFGTLTGGSEGAFAGTFKGDTGLTSFVPKPVFSGINAYATNSVFTDIFNGATNMVTDCYNAGYAPSTSSDRCHSFETQPKWGNGNGDEIVRCCGEQLRSITYNPGASTAINASTGTSTPAIQYTPENEDFTTLSIGTFENDGYLMSKWNWLEGFGYDEPNHALLPQTRYNYSVPVDTIVEPDWAPCSCDYGNDSGVAECHVHTVNEEVNNVMTNRCGDLEVKCKPGWVNPTWSCNGLKCGASCSRGIFDITLDYNGGTPAGGNNYVVGHVSGENTLIGHIFLKYGIGFYETAQDAANDTNNNRYLPNLSGSTEQSFSTSYIPGPVDNKPYQGFYGAYTVQQQQQNNDRGGVGVSDSEIQIINRQGNFTTISTTFTTSDATITARYGDPIYTLTLDDAGGYNGSNQIFLRYQSTTPNGPFTPKFYDNYENAFREIDPINRVAIPENPGYRFEGYLLPPDSYTASKPGVAVDTAGIIASTQFVTGATVPGPKRITDDVTLTAQWSARFLPVCLDHNGATNASAFHDKVWLEYNTDYYNDNNGGYGSVIHYVDITNDNGSVIPQKTGYVFNGYLGPEQGAIRSGEGGSSSTGNFPLVVNSNGLFINKSFATEEGNKSCVCDRDIAEQQGLPLCPTFITADYSKEVYEITLDQNGGSGGTPSKAYLWYSNDFYSNSAATQQLGGVTAPTRDGYTFTGYYHGNCDGNGGIGVCTQIMDDGGRVIAGRTTFTRSNTTIKAMWAPNIYEITVNDNCGANPCQTSGAPTTLYVRYGDAWYRTRANALAGTNSIDAMDTNPARTGYSFEGYTNTRVIGRSGGGNGGGSTNGVTITRVTDNIGRFLTTEFTTEDTTINADWLGACNLVALNPNQGTAGTVNKLFKRTGSAAWYSDGNCTTQYVTTSDVIPTRQNYVFRGFYAAPAPADVNSDADNTGLTQYIMTNGALSYEGYNLVVSGETVIYAAWARECNSINPGECHLDVLLDGTVTYTVDCPDGFQENGEGTWNPSCTPVCYPITVDNTRRGGTTANSLLYKFGGGSNATKWYSDSTCATEVATTPAPSKLNATFNGYYWVSGAATRDGGTGNSEFTLVQVGSDDSPSELSDEWTVTGPETIVAYYDCNSHYTENGVDIVGVCANSIYDITLNDNGGSNGNGTVYEKYNAGYALDRDAQLWDLTQLTNIPSYTGYGFRGYYSTQVTPLEANGNTGTLVIKKAGTLPTSPTYFEDDTTVYAGWARDCVSPVAHGSCLRSISDEGAVTYTTSCDSGYVLRSGTGGTYNPICDPGVFTVTLDSKYYASANATGVNADTNAAPSPIYVRYADNWYKSTTINSSNLISALTTNPLYSTYVFDGFWTEKTGTGTKIIDRTGAILSGHTTDFTDNGVLYAKWVQTTCSVTNGTGTPLAPVNNVPACSISCTNGYSQNGYLDTTTTFTANGTAGSNAVTASCAARTYQVTLDPKRYESSSATTGVNPDTVGTAAYWYVFNSSSPAYFYSVEVASAADQVWANRLGSNGYTIVRPTMTGYTFGGYFVGKTGIGNQYMSDGGSAINNLWSNTGTDGRHDITLYAKWTPITYSIAYDLKGGDAPSGNNASDFMPVEYIASTSGGNQYIDTLHTLQSDNVVYKWTARDVSSSSGTSLFGTEGTQSGTRVFSGVLYGSKSTRTLWVGSSQALSIGYASNDSLYHDWKLHAANNTVSLTKDGTLVNSRAYDGSLYKDKNIVLFGNRTGSTGASQYALATLKHFSIEDNGALVFNGIPVRKISTDQCGLYDTVSGGFFPSGSSTPFDCPSSSARPTTATYDLAFGPVVQPTRPHSTFVGWNITNMSTDTAHYKGTTSGNLSTFASGVSSATGITDSWFKNLRSVSGPVTFTANWTCDVGYASNAAGTSCDAVNYPMSYTCSDGAPDYTYSDTVPSSQTAHYLQTAPVGTGVHLPAANSCQKIYGTQGTPEYCADCFDLDGWYVEAERAALFPQAAPLHSVNGTIQTFGRTNGTNWCQVGDLNADWGSGTAGECNGGLSGTSFELYPHYEPKTYTISYMYATSTGPDQTGNRPDSHTYTLTTNIRGDDLSLAHGTFVGWCKDDPTMQSANCTGTETSVGPHDYGNHTYYAKWACDTGYTLGYNNNNEPVCNANVITFNWQNGGHGTAPTTPVNCTYDGTFNMPVAMTATGYTFQKWITSGTTTTQFDAGATNVACTEANLGVTSGTATVTGSWSVNSYPIIIVAGRGISAVSATGWVSDGNGGITKTFNYGDPIDLTTITKTYKNGYIDTAYSATGAGTLSGSNFTVGDGAATITIAAGGIADPTGVNLTISDTEKTYNKSATTLTASQTRTYDSAIHVYYKYGNTSTFTTGNCPTSYAYPPTGITSTTKSISATEYLGKQCYKVKVYASDDSLTSGEVEYTGTKQLHLLKRAVTFNVASGETLVGTATGYAQYNSATLYNGPYSTTTVAAPTATKAGHDFKGWYTLSANGDKVYNATPTLQSGVSNITNNSAQWILDENLALYAQFDLRQITCPATKYLPAGGESASDCTCCLAGYYCPGDTFWYDANNDQGLTVCPAGSFCATCVAAPTACVKGSYTATTGQSACTACQNGLTTSAAGRTSCNANCSNASGAYSWSNATWNNNNTMTNLCTITACDTNYYPTANNSGNSCTSCTSFANGLYPYTESTTLVSSVASVYGGDGRRACFLYRRQINGSHIAENFALSSTQCAAGTYSYYEPSSTIKTFFGQSYDCDICPVDTYSGAGATSCTDCLPGYITNDQGSGSASDCRIYCDGGYYLAHANDTSCDPVGPGHWAPGAWVSQGQTSTYSNCPAGMTTIGYGPGADEVGDCGRKLHVGDDLLYLRSLKKTEPSLNVLVENTRLYGNMSPIPLHMSADIDHMLRLPYEQDIYSVHDDSAETRLSIEQMRGLMGESSPIGGEIGFISHDGGNSSNDEIDGTDYGAWYVDFESGAKAAAKTVRVRGTSTCSKVESKAKGGYVTASDQAGVQKDYLANQQRAPKEDPLGTNCYCKVTNAEAPDVQWVLDESFEKPDRCGGKCAKSCAAATGNKSDFRDVLFRLGAVYASELTAADLEKLIADSGIGRTYWVLSSEKPEVDGTVITPAEHNADWGVAFDYKGKPVQVNGVSACSTLDSGKYQIATDGGLVELQYQMSMKKVPNSKPAGNICYCRVTDPNISGLQWVQALDAKTYDSVEKCSEECAFWCAKYAQKDPTEVFKSVLFTPQSNSGNGLSETDLKNLIEEKAIGHTYRDVLKGDVFSKGQPMTTAKNYGDWGVAFDYNKKPVQVNGISVCGHDYNQKPFIPVTDDKLVEKIEEDYRQQMKVAPTNEVGERCYCKVTDPDLAGLPWAMFKKFDNSQSCAAKCSAECAESIAGNRESERSVLFTPTNGSSSNLTQADLDKLVGEKYEGSTWKGLDGKDVNSDGSVVTAAKNYGDWGTSYVYKDELVQINGISACADYSASVGTIDTSGEVQSDYAIQISKAPTNEVGGACWCKLTDPAVPNTYWVEINDKDDKCATGCAKACAMFATHMGESWQRKLFGLSTSGLTQQDLDNLIKAEFAGFTSWNVANDKAYKEGKTVSTAKSYGDWGAAYMYKDELVQINGISACSEYGDYFGATDTSGKVQNDYAIQISKAPTDKVGNTCWCKLTDPMVSNSYWVQGMVDEKCGSSCATWCSLVYKQDLGWQQTLFGLKN